MKKTISAILALALCLGLALPVTAAGKTAYASTQSVEVDGKAVRFQMYALRDANGNDTNYVKLRDVAHVLNSTPAKFSVGYDNATDTISVTTGQSYASTGAEMTTPYSGNRAYRTGSGAVMVDGKAVSMEAIVLTDDNGGDYTYFKLRDLGSALGFKVDWSEQRGVTVSTSGTSAPVEPEKPAGTDGKLANGKPITEENVLALLKEVERKYPTGMLWCPITENPATNYNPNPVSGAVEAVFRRYHIDTKDACGGFAAMVSDLVFGTEGNYLRKLDDIADIRPGDIILRMKGNVNQHVMIAMSNTFTTNGFTGVYVAEGNANDRVVWSTDADHNTRWLANINGDTYVVYTRYPA